MNICLTINVMQQQMNATTLCCWVSNKFCTWFMQTNTETNTAHIHVLKTELWWKNRKLECNQIIEWRSLAMWCLWLVTYSMCKLGILPHSHPHIGRSSQELQTKSESIWNASWWIVLPYHIPAKQWISAAASVPPQTIVEFDVCRKAGNTFFIDWSGGVYVHCNCQSTSPHVQQGACCEHVDYSLTPVGLGKINYTAIISSTMVAKLLW